MQKNTYRNFWNYYIKNISPKLKQIDILLKGKLYNIPLKTISVLLDLSEKEIQAIMSEKNITCVTSDNFLTIMLNGKSYICTTLKKEFEKKSPHKYSAEDIAYIYNIDLGKIKNAFNFLEINQISSDKLQSIFIQKIP